ncbi:MAG: tRNA (adenosine(37)-N6)-dimethylallyltransferase MiaA [Flavobacteriales bacterium]
MSKYLIVIAGPTGIGKTNLSIEIAKKYNAEILSCDSRQFFKEMSIGTAVPTKKELEEVKHHFIQNISIEQEYSVGKFELDALRKINEIHNTNKVVVMVGGSGLYIDAVCRGLDHFPDVPKILRDELNLKHEKQGIEVLKEQLDALDPEYYKEVDQANPHRIIRALEICIHTGKTFTSFRKQQQKARQFKTVKLILTRDREELYERINKRVDFMMAQGLLEEAQNLYKHKENNALQTVGYKELFAYFDGEWDLETAILEIKKNTRRYAKRQMTWYRRDSNSIFFDPSDTEGIVKYIETQIKA